MTFPWNWNKKTEHDKSTVFEEANAALRKDYNTLMSKYGTLESKIEQLQGACEGLEASLKAQVLAHYEQADKNAELTRVIGDYGVAIDALEQRNAQLLTLLEEANALFKSIPASKLSQERAARIAQWQARWGKLAIPDKQEQL